MSMRLLFSCDNEGCRKTIEVTARKWGKIREQAKKNGWEFSNSGATCLCPDCVRVKNSIGTLNINNSLENDKIHSIKKELVAETYSVNQYDAARILNVSMSFLQRRRFMGMPPVYSRVGNQVRYRVKDLEEFMKEYRVDPKYI